MDGVDEHRDACQKQLLRLVRKAVVRPFLCVADDLGKYFAIIEAVDPRKEKVAIMEEGLSEWFSVVKQLDLMVLIDKYDDQNVEEDIVVDE
ncbi:hypothetical protein Ddye_017895 [Dipteronia dyeriana]|uniref:Uncharacterized protein n=1 Tax=Dipteronia dyeriana TaxID=168575 RepID=A0AAD9UA33_9ROSI|nr:hypothetical protein Ddye_017895 [Dipteronia dyeriana]